jgi:hypothetical protein
MKEHILFKHIKEEYYTISNLRKAMLSVKKNYIPKIKLGNKTAVISIDCYDLFDWIFPQGFSYHDHHYEGVHNLWCTVEEYLNPNDYVKICVPPGSAMEMFHLLKQKVDQARLAMPIPSRYNSISELNESGKALLKNYNSIKKVLNGLDANEYTNHLMDLCDKKMIISFHDLMKISDTDMLSYNSIVGSKMNYQAGYNYLQTTREQSRSGIPREYADYSIIIDMLNLQNNIYLNDYLNKNDGHFAIMTTHGAYTLHSWRISYMGDRNAAPFNHSNIALILTKTLKNCGDINTLNDFLDEAIEVCNRQLTSLKKYKEIFDYFELQKTDIDLNTNIVLDEETIVNRMYWHQHFSKLLDSNKHLYDNLRSTEDIEEANDWANQSKSQDVIRLEQKAKEIYDKTSFLSPEMRNIFLPLIKNTDEILKWIND